MLVKDPGTRACLFVMLSSISGVGGWVLQKEKLGHSLPLLTVACKEQYTRLLFFLECLSGGSVSLGLAKSSNSIQEATLGGLHSAIQARTVGAFPEVLAALLCLYLHDKWRGVSCHHRESRRDIQSPSDEVRSAEEPSRSPCRKVPLIQVSRRWCSHDWPHGRG